MKRVFITGATGDVGRAILPVLAKYYSITALVKKIPPYSIENVDWVKGDVGNLPSYKKLLRGVHGVVHLAALLRSGNVKQLAIENVENTRILVEASHAAGCERIIVFSTAAVTQDVLTPYAASKKKMEEILHQKNIPLYIIRPTLAYGKNSHYIKQFQKLAHGKSPFVFLPNHGKAILSPVHHDDIGQGLIALLKKIPSRVKTYDFCPEDNFTLMQFWTDVSASESASKIIVSPPHEWLVKLVRALSRMHLPVPLILVSAAAAGYSYRVHPHLFARDFGIKFKSASEILPSLCGEKK